MALLVGVTLAGCSSTRAVTNTKRTAMQQLVVSEAVDRALLGLEWPSFPGQRVWVEARGPSEPHDQKYLEGAVERELMMRGAIPAPDRPSADIVATVLIGSLGTEQVSRFFGVPQMQSVLLPVPVPEIGLYKSERQDGFAKVEVTYVDPEERHVLLHAGPGNGDAYWAEYRVLFFGFYRTSTSREPKGIFDTLKEPEGSPARTRVPPPVLREPPNA